MASKQMSKKELKELLEFALDNDIEMTKHEVVLPSEAEVRSICDELHLWAEYKAYVCEHSDPEHAFYAMLFSKKVSSDHIETFARFFSPDFVTQEDDYSVVPKGEHE